jgi:hypothetical protein
MSYEINIITTAVTQWVPMRGGGEEQSLVSAAAKKVGVAADALVEQIAKTVGVVSGAIDKMESASRNYSVDEITLSLAITAEGDIGLVSAGAEATIEIKFKKRD